MNKKKVLLMGKAGSGKTSMRSIIFANNIARETMRLGPTLGQEVSNVQFLGNLILHLWDCGGQDQFMESYFISQRDRIFRNVEVLIYVFDVDPLAVDARKKDLLYFTNCLDAIKEFSPDAQIFCLVHKMDLVAQQKQVQVFQAMSKELQAAADPLRLTTFGTSIWDETLYKAWSEIVFRLVPNLDQLEAKLTKFCKLCGADEVVLFEMTTFLVISKATIKQNLDPHRYELISNMVHQFKLSCTKIAPKGFSSIEVKNKRFSAFIDEFTSSTYIMIVMSDPKIQSAATYLNLQAARSHFEKFVKSTVGRC
jgi:Ras-related GTP-binding protein A/B